MHQGLGIRTSVISADDVHRMVPTFDTEDFDVAAYEPDSGYADPILTAGSLLDAARRRDARFTGECEVRAISSIGGRVKGVRTSKGDFSAPVIVNAAGAWADRVANMVQVDLPLTTWTHDVAHVRRPRSLRRIPP
jgi:sarcosine oxidase subunit beta